MDTLLGQHFPDPEKNWQSSKQLRVPFVDLAYAQDHYAGYSVQESMARVSDRCWKLRQAGLNPMPILRLDFSPSMTIFDTPWFYRQFLHVCEKLGSTDALMVLGNEPNLDGRIHLSDIEKVYRNCLSLIEVLGIDMKLLATPIAPFCPTNVHSAQDFLPMDRREVLFDEAPVRSAATEWENWQYGLARRLADLPIEGYALHVYGRPQFSPEGMLAPEAKEPLSPWGTFTGRFGAEWGVGWWRDADVAIRTADKRGKAYHITECNTHTDNNSSYTYPKRWLTNLLRVLDEDGLCVHTLNWFVGRADTPEWMGDSMHHRFSQMADADDDFNQHIGLAEGADT